LSCKLKIKELRIFYYKLQLQYIF